MCKIEANLSKRFATQGPNTIKLCVRKAERKKKEKEKKKTTTYFQKKKRKKEGPQQLNSEYATK